MEKAVTREELVEELHLADTRGARARKAQRVAEDVDPALSRPIGERPWFLADKLAEREGVLNLLLLSRNFLLLAIPPAKWLTP